MNKYLIILILSMTNRILLAQPTIIAHRGSSFLAPENTVASALLAWQQQADAVELDIYLSADNRVMVMHDSNTKRTTGQSYKISETSSEVLRTLDAGSWKGEQFRNEKIPFLEEMIATVPQGKKMVIEIKCGPEVFPALQKIAEQCGKKKQLIFIAFDWETIVKARQIFPENACYWLSSSASAAQEKTVEAAKIKLEGLNLNYRIVDQVTVQRAKESGLEVLSWTIDDPQEVKRLIGLGVTAITTNRPDLVRESIR
jgi:glycerophosphoryl diester phosphodiesterase